MASPTPTPTVPTRQQSPVAEQYAEVSTRAKLVSSVGSAEDAVAVVFPPDPIRVVEDTDFVVLVDSVDEDDIEARGAPGAERPGASPAARAMQT